MLCGNLQSKILATLNVTWIISFVIQVYQGFPCIGTHKPAWGTNKPCLKLYETVGLLLHGLCAPFLKLKIEQTKLQAANWNTLMVYYHWLLPIYGKLIFGINIWRWIKTKSYFKDQSWKFNNTTTRYVFIHLEKINHQCIFPMNVSSKRFNAKPLLVELDVTRGR